MFPRRLLRHRMHRFGMLVVVFAFLLQTFAVASMPWVSVSADEEMVVICTGTGMKTVPLSQFLNMGIGQEQEQPAPETLSGGVCAICLLSHNVAITSSVACGAAIDLNAHAPQAPPVDEPVLSGFPRVQQARAPPSLV